MPRDASPPLAPTAPDAQGASSARRGRRSLAWLTNILTGRRLRRRTRWLLRILVFVPLGALLLLMIALRSPLVGMVVRSSIESSLGCRFQAGSAAVNLDGRLVLERVRLFIPSMPGPEGEFLTAGRAEIDLDWSGLLIGSVRPTGLRFYDPVFRVSLGEEDGKLNLDALGGAPGSPGAQPPRINAISGRVEFGEHSATGSHYKALKSIFVDGDFTPADPRRPIYELKLQELVHTVAAAPAPASRRDRAAKTARPVERHSGMFLEGRLDLSSSDAEIRLHNVGLEDWRPEAVPTSLRNLWTRLDIKGSIPLTTFKYAPGSGLSATLTVESVAMNALIPAGRPEVAGQQTLALTGVNGEIHLANSGLQANLSGNVEGSPCHVALRTQGTDLNAPLRCEISAEHFQVEHDPPLLAYVPEVVHRHFATFSGPTAVVDALVVVERGPPPAPGPGGEPAPFSITGSISFKNGAAKFDKFPYPVSDLKGLVAFSDQKVEILNIQGRGPSGAIVRAEGLIQPPNQDAAIHIEVLALDVPVDHWLEETLDPDQRKVLTALFNREQHQRLVERGLVLQESDRPALTAALGDLRAQRRLLAESPATPAARLADLDARLADTQRRLDAPPLDFGGKANLAITVDSKEGKDQPFTYTVQIKFPTAGMVPGAFPFPIKATNVALVLDGSELRLTGGDFTGLNGGHADLQARIVLKSPDSPEFQPFVHIHAERIPVDELLISAVPDDADGGTALRAVSAPGADPDREPAPGNAGTEDTAPRAVPPAFSTKALLENLHIAGTVSCDADLTPGPGGRTAVNAAVTLERLYAAPRIAEAGEGAEPGVALRDLSGSIHITDRAITIDNLTGTLTPPGLDADTADALGRVSLRLSAAFTDPPPAGAPDIAPLSRPPASLEARIGVSDLDLGASVEDLVRLFSPRSAARLGETRRLRSPTGHIDALVSLSQAGAADPTVSLRVDHARALAFDALGGRVSIDHRHGPVTASPGDLLALAFSDTDAQVLFNGEPAMSIGLNGSISIRLDSGPVDFPLPQGDLLAAHIRDARFEAPFTRAILDEALGSPDHAGPDLDSIDPRGTFDADLLARPRRPAPIEGGRYAVSGSIAPHSLSLMRSGSRFEFPTVTGRVSFDGARGRFESLAAAAPRWSLSLDGDWRADAGGYRLDTDLTLAAPGLLPEVRAALPAAVQRVLERLAVEIGGPVALTNAHLSLTLPPPPAAAPDDGEAPDEASVAFSGTLAFSGASCDVGIGLQRCEGSVRLQLDRTAGARSATFDALLNAGSLAVAGLPMTSAQARIVSGSIPGQVLVPQCSADFFGGRFSASAVALTEPTDESPALSYQVDLLVAGARFAPILESLAAKAPVLAGSRAIEVGATPTSMPPDASTDDTRGRLDAAFSIAGRSGDTASRHGRGSIRIGGGDVIRLPLMLQLMQMSNFQLPTEDRLDYLQAQFDLRGTRLSFDQIAVMSEGISILGDGSLAWPDLDLDLRFNTKTADSRRIPLVSDLFETVRNELITTVITGTLREPKFSTVSLPSTMRMLSGVFDPEGSRRESATDITERSARLERQRLRGAAPQGQAPTFVLPPPGRAAAAASALP